MKPSECATMPGDGASALIVYLADEATTRPELTVILVEGVLEALCEKPEFDLTLGARGACTTFAS